MNLAIYEHGSNQIRHFVRNAKQTDKNDYQGDGIRLCGIKPAHWAFIWTVEDVGPVLDRAGNQIGWDRTADQITPCMQFQGHPVENEADIDRITCRRISETYPIEEELRILRKQAMGALDKKEWDAYVAFVEGRIEEGRTVKTNIRGEK